MKTQEELKDLLQESVRGLVENVIDTYIDTEWNSWDFHEQIQDDIDECQVEIEFTETNDQTCWDITTYNKFIDMVVNDITSRLIINQIK